MPQVVSFKSFVSRDQNMSRIWRYSFEADLGLTIEMGHQVRNFILMVQKSQNQNEKVD